MDCPLCFSEMQYEKENHSSYLQTSQQGAHGDPPCPDSELTFSLLPSQGFAMPNPLQHEELKVLSLLVESTSEACNSLGVLSESSSNVASNRLPVVPRPDETSAFGNERVGQLLSVRYSLQHIVIQQCCVEVPDIVIDIFGPRLFKQNFSTRTVMMKRFTAAIKLHFGAY